METKRIIPKFIFARYNEDVSWIKKYPFIDKNSHIYNRGDSGSLDDMGYIVTDIGNKPIYSRESGAYLIHIINNYDCLSDYTIFSQANPFEHSKYFVEMIAFGLQNNLLKDFQPLSYTWKIKENIPPKNNIFYNQTDYIGKYPIYIETIDTKLQPFSYTDNGMKKPIIDFIKHHNLTRATNLIDFIFYKLKLERLLTTNYLKFNYGGIFGVNKYNILQHKKSFYENLLNFVNEHYTHGFIMERMWYTIFLSNTELQM